jgi:hypothetical protein
MSTKPTPGRQVLLRLPEDLAERFATVVPPRKRSRYLVELLRKELDRESYELSLAARRLTELELGCQSLQAENEEWLNSPLVEEADGFDRLEFERQFQEAQTSL